MPLRKKVMAAPCCLASPRNRENSLLSSSPAPSQEKTTNCGGRSPGPSRAGFGWYGCGPVSAVEPSPIGVAVGVGLGTAGAVLGVAETEAVAAGLAACSPLVAALSRPQPAVSAAAVAA